MFCFFLGFFFGRVDCLGGLVVNLVDVYSLKV